MRNLARVMLAVAVMAVVPLSASVGIVAVVDFESHSASATYGITPAGAVGFRDSGIAFHVREFTSSTGATTAGMARIVATAAGHVLELNNVLLSVQTSGLSAPVTEVVIEYVDMGGQENLRVNGTALLSGDLQSFAPAVTPGVELFMTRVSIPGGVRGKLLLRGRIQSFDLGGQELRIDNIVFRSCD